MMEPITSRPTMITRMTFNGAAFDRDEPPPLSAGESAVLAVWGDGFISVQIECIKGFPPPPVVSPCASCGTYAYRSGTSFRISAPTDVFGSDTGGAVRVRIADSNDTVTLEFALRSKVRAEAYYE
jgi:hypothetical protein